MNETDYHVRRAEEEDISALIDVLESVAGEGRWIATEQPIDKDARAQGLRDRFYDVDAAVTYVAELDGAIVGSAGLEQVTPGLLRLGMAIVKEHRRKGLGARLVRQCLDHAKAQGAHKVVLEVWPHNSGAISLYERFGFEQEGYFRRHYRRKSGELWDSVVMGLRLPGPPGD